MIIRAARVEDAPAIARLAAEDDAGAWTERSIAEELARPQAEVLVAERPGSEPGSSPLAGFAVAWFVAGELGVLSIAVARSERRRGIGARLFAALLDRGRTRGCSELHLEVRAGNSGARGFYGALGLTEVGVRRGYYANNGEDAVLMSRPLT